MRNPGAWLGWVDANTPPEQRENATSQVVRRWTNNDFRATAAWIGEQPPSPLRDRATRTFAEAVAPHEPDTAANWALTLPASEDRTNLLRNIHRQ
jgi:hypothetical protein